MATIETKYDFGQLAWFVAKKASDEKQECTDCLGLGKTRDAEDVATCCGVCGGRGDVPNSYEWVVGSGTVEEIRVHADRRSQTVTCRVGDFWQPECQLYHSEAVAQMVCDRLNAAETS